MSTPPTERRITYAEAINEALHASMAQDPGVIIFGLGVDDPKRVFGTTKNLSEKYGPKRVFDVPVSENALTGIAIGAATRGLRPVLTHQRLDFALLSLDQIINNAAKWSYMFGGRHRAPITIRMILGRGWGQGPQHSQHLHALFSHIPGLQVVLPSTPHDAKGLLISSIESDDPVIFLEHRWLHAVSGPVPSNVYREPIGKAKVVREGTDLTIVGISYMALEAFRAAEQLARVGVSAEVIDLRTAKPIDYETVLSSVSKTGRLIVADTGHLTCGVSAEIVATVTERLFSRLKSPPKRIASPDSPVPTSPALSRYYYPRSHDIAREAAASMSLAEPLTTQVTEALIAAENTVPADVPDLNFSGPF